MTYIIHFTKSAKSDVDGLDTVIQKRLGKKLLQIVDLDDVRPLAKKLSGNLAETYRIRLGDYRILFDLEGNDIIILRVQHRKDVYR